MDTQIDRIADEFPKNERSEESHELEREEYQNTGGREEILPVGGNNDYRPIPSLGGDRAVREERPIINATQRRRGRRRKLYRWKLN